MKIIKQLEAISGQKESSSSDNVPKLILKNQQQQNNQIKITQSKSNASLSSKSMISSTSSDLDTMLNPIMVSGQNNNKNKKIYNLFWF